MQCSRERRGNGKTGDLKGTVRRSIRAIEISSASGVGDVFMIQEDTVLTAFGHHGFRSNRIKFPRITYQWSFVRTKYSARPSRIVEERELLICGALWTPARWPSGEPCSSRRASSQALNGSWLSGG